MKILNCQPLTSIFIIGSYDLDYGGLGIGDEGERLASKLGNHSVLMMGQHGVLVTGKTVGEAFDRMYYFERSARIYITALQTGQKLRNCFS